MGIQLLKNGNFDLGYDDWLFFEGAHLIGITDEETTGSVAFIPNWSDSQYAGFMQNQIVFDPIYGQVFTLTFRAKFESNYSASQTLIQFLNHDGMINLYSIDINDQIVQNLGQWATYEVTYDASSFDFTSIGSSLDVLFQPYERNLNLEETNIFVHNLNLFQKLN
jgi:hypothetical protein